MQTFRDLDRHLGLVPQELLLQLTTIERAKGRQELYRRQSPQVLEALLRVARVQSVEASNAIENITAPAARIKELVEEKTAPQNRSEAEIAGYRAVLDLIQMSAADIPFKPSVVEQLHRDLHQFLGETGSAGRWKRLDNVVEEELADGTKRIRFRPVSASATPEAMEELHRLFNTATAGGRFHHLLLTGAYALDFLVIHPFTDGNGRMSRLLTLLLLCQGGYEVGRFVSIEKLMEESKDGYYEALGASTAGWHEGEHNLLPWLSYFLGVITRASVLFEERVGAVARGKGAKADAIKTFIRMRASDRFTVADVRAAVPTAGDHYIRQILRELKNEGVLDQPTRGPNASWRRMHQAF